MVVGCLFSQSALKYSSSQLCVIRLIVGAHSCHWRQLNVDWAVKTAAIQTKPACAGSKTSDFPLVRAGRLGFCSRDFQSPWA